MRTDHVDWSARLSAGLSAGPRELLPVARAASISGIAAAIVVTTASAAVAAVASSTEKSARFWPQKPITRCARRARRRMRRTRYRTRAVAVLLISDTHHTATPFSGSRAVV